MKESLITNIFKELEIQLKSKLEKTMDNNIWRISWKYEWVI